MPAPSPSSAQCLALSSSHPFVPSLQPWEKLHTTPTNRPAILLLILPLPHLQSSRRFRAVKGPSSNLPRIHSPPIALLSLTTEGERLLVLRPEHSPALLTTDFQQAMQQHFTISKQSDEGKRCSQAVTQESHAWGRMRGFAEPKLLLPAVDV